MIWYLVPNFLDKSLSIGTMYLVELTASFCSMPGPSTLMLFVRLAALTFIPVTFLIIVLNRFASHLPTPTRLFNSLMAEFIAESISAPSSTAFAMVSIAR